MLLSVLSIKGPTSLLLGLYNFSMCYVTLPSKLNYRKMIFYQIIFPFSVKIFKKMPKMLVEVNKIVKSTMRAYLRGLVISVFVQPKDFSNRKQQGIRAPRRVTYQYKIILVPASAKDFDCQNPKIQEYYMLCVIHKRPNQSLTGLV